PGAPGRGPGGAGQQARLVRAGPAGARDRAGPARHTGTGADVSPGKQPARAAGGRGNRTRGTPGLSPSEIPGLSPRCPRPGAHARPMRNRPGQRGAARAGTPPPRGFGAGPGAPAAPPAWGAPTGPAGPAGPAGPGFAGYQVPGLQD